MVNPAGVPDLPAILTPNFASLHWGLFIGSPLWGFDPYGDYNPPILVCCIGITHRLAPLGF